MGRLSLHIVYEGTEQAVSAVSVKDRRILIEAAKAALCEQTKAAEGMFKNDPFIGELKGQEVQRLESLLTRFLPELRA